MPQPSCEIIIRAQDRDDHLISIRVIPDRRKIEVKLGEGDWQTFDEWDVNGLGRAVDTARKFSAFCPP